MISRDDIMSAVEKEFDDLLTGAPENLSAKVLKAIKEESINHTKRLLDALTTQELQSAGAYNRFLENTLAQARMRMHTR
jgi:hypothetical protein